MSDMLPFAASSKLYIPDITMSPLHAAYRVSQQAIDAFEIGVKTAIDTIAAHANESADAILSEQKAYVESAISAAEASAESATGQAEGVVQGHLAWLVTIADDLGIPPSPQIAALRGLPATPSLAVPPATAGPAVTNAPAVMPLSPPAASPIRATPLAGPVVSPGPVSPAPPTLSSGPIESDNDYWGFWWPDTKWGGTLICNQIGQPAIYMSGTDTLITGSPRSGPAICYMDALGSDYNIVIPPSALTIFVYVATDGTISRATDIQVRTVIPAGPAQFEGTSSSLVDWIKANMIAASCTPIGGQPSQPVQPPIVVTPLPPPPAPAPTPPPAPSPPGGTAGGGGGICPPPNIIVEPCKPVINVYSSDQAWLQRDDKTSAQFQADMSALFGQFWQTAQDAGTLADHAALANYAGAEEIP